MESPRRFNLLGLPLEIRNQIYSYVLTFSKPLFLTTLPYGACDLALLRVSKGLVCEAAPIFYENNVFQLECNFQTILEDEDDESKEFYTNLTSPPDILYIGLTRCISIEVPYRYMSSLRRLSLIRPFASHWPDRSHMDPQSLLRGEPDLPDELEEMSNVFQYAISFLVANASMITSLSLDVRMSRALSYNDWDPDPSIFLWTVDPFRQTAHAVGYLHHLKQLELWKTRKTFARVGRKEHVCDWTAVKEEELHRVRREHYPYAKEILYCRKRIGETEPEMHRNFSEGFSFRFS